MGRRGPAPAPTKVTLARGEPHRDRLNFREPMPRRASPPMPGDLDPAARAVWRRVVREMPAGVITGVDGEILRCYCEAASRYAAAAKLLAASGALVRGARHGDLIKNPLHQVVRDNADAVRLFARELGLSPSARAGLHMEISPWFPDIVAEIGLPPRLRMVTGQLDGA